MLRFPRIRFVLLLPAVFAVLMPLHTSAQDDPNETPLGDIARNLRKTNPSAQKIIDDDNLAQEMERADSRHDFGASLRYMMAGESKGFQVSAPDATCSLSFTANVKSLLSNQYAQMDMPVDDAAKLEGPATIEGDALTVSVFNGTNWHVSEITVALTVVRKNKGAGEPASEDSLLQAVRPEKRQDVTVIYRMRAPAAPWERAVFSAPLNLELAPGDEWHWAIVQAKGYPPQGSTANAAMASSLGAAAQPMAVSVSAGTQNTPATTTAPEQK